MKAIVSAGLPIRHAAILITVLSLMPGIESGALGEIRYTVTDLGALGPKSVSHPSGINNSGQVVGVTDAYPGTYHGFLYSAGFLTDLTPGMPQSGAYDINETGQIAGYRLLGGTYSAFIYSNGLISSLGTLPGYYSSEAHGINNNGQAVGYTLSPGIRAFLYSNGSLIDLGTLPGYARSQAFCINDSGQVVGGASSSVDGTARAFLYLGGTMTALGTLGGAYSFAYHINNAGQIVGCSTNSDGRLRAFLYSGGSMSDLGTLGGSSSAAYGLNDLGQVVGWASTVAAQHASLWDGQIHDLNNLVATNSGWTLKGAYAINDQGQIAAWSVDASGANHAVLLTPLSPNNPPLPRCRNVLVSATANCRATASIDDGSSDPDGDPIALAQSPPGPYPIGTNFVTLTATDSHGASNSCSALVVVQDTSAPQITCPAHITVNCTSRSGAIVTFAPMASDECSVPTVSSLPPSGSQFPIGTTAVFCAATDSSGNSASCSFQVTVLSPRQMLEGLLQSAGTTAPRPQALSASLNAALAALDRGNALAAMNQLAAFQKKVQAQVAPADAALGERLSAAAEDIIKALRAGA